MKYLLGFLFLLAGLGAGNWFPDVDQKTELLLHRSIVTHGPLVPLIVLAVASSTSSVPIRWFALGVTLGFASHLSFDLFPRGWSGFALISIPTYGWTAAWFSWTWIALNVVACVYLALRLVRGLLDSSMFLFSLIFGFSYISMDENAFWRPVAALTIATAISVTLVANRAISSDH